MQLLLMKLDADATVNYQLDIHPSWICFYLTVFLYSCPKIYEMLSPYNKPQRIVLFKNKYLEQMTIISPKTFAVTWSLVIPFVVWTSWGGVSVPYALGLVCAGWLIWSLCEYALHRFVFHLDLDFRIVRWFVFIIHGNHHDHPNDPMRDMMPLSVSLPVSALMWAGLQALAGRDGNWLFLGWVMGYVLYDMIHYACHQWSMRGRFAAAIKRHHMRHHYVDESANYGISSTLWDRFFNTRIKTLKR